MLEGSVLLDLEIVEVKVLEFADDLCGGGASRGVNEERSYELELTVEKG